MKLDDQVLVVAIRLGLGRLQSGKNFLDPVDAAQDQGDRFGRDRHSVTEFTHQRLGGMRQRFQARETEKAAGPLDRVNQAKDVIQNLRVVRILLETHQLVIDGVQAFAGLRQKLTQQIVHKPAFERMGA